MGAMMMGMMQGWEGGGESDIAGYGTSKKRKTEGGCGGPPAKKGGSAKGDGRGVLAQLPMAMPQLALPFWQGPIVGMGEGAPWTGNGAVNDPPGSGRVFVR